MPTEDVLFILVMWLWVYMGFLLPNTKRRDSVTITNDQKSPDTFPILPTSCRGNTNEE